MINHQNIKDNYFGWYKQIGYIPQDIYLLDDTIKNVVTTTKVFLEKKMAYPQK